MGLVDKIKNEAQGKRIVIQDSKADELSKILNRTFYLDKNIEEETKFVKMVMTRGAETQERIGLHASALITSDNSFCLRQQVLSLVYRQQQGEQLEVGLLRIFEEGNAVHEKWQRLFIRAGYSKATDLDVTQFNKKYRISFTPDIICEIPEFHDGKMVGEIKSVNTYQFQKMTHHPSAGKQLQWYMYLTGIHKGFVLSDDKNNQQFKLEVYDFDPEKVQPFIDRAEEIKKQYKRLISDHKLVARPEAANSPTCKFCKNCALNGVCWGRIKGEKING